MGKCEQWSLAILFVSWYVHVIRARIGSTWILFATSSSKAGKLLDFNVQKWF